ncbi:TetR/AcrR family transcriptional regulator [Streptomyces sp. NPDC014870]|uniref:TetR/AcrR family transcriptional regulator n=1 Tax=Streptomyces sp. NPDC014870 TaxID=3364925 RepID=UPI0036FB7B1B
MTSVQGARARARIEITAAIKDEARAQLAAEGAAKLSLRAVAREVGMVSSALYRYFPSRDDLLTALIIDAYDAVGAAAEQALADSRAATAPDDHLARWTAVCRAVRAWAVAHPHEYALIYGSPVPGYSAPQDTIGPASRVALVLIGILGEALAAEGVAPPPVPAALRPEAERIAAEFARDLPPAHDLPPALAVAMVAAWSQLFGLVSFEVFGQFNRVVEDRETFFATAADRLGREIGLLARS